MRNLLLISAIILLGSCVFSQKFNETKLPSFPDSLIIGNWVLKEWRFIKFGDNTVDPSQVISEEKENNISNSDASKSKIQSNQDLLGTTNNASEISLDSSKLATLIEKKHSIAHKNQFEKIMAEKDSVIFRYRNDMPEDSVITLVIRPDFTFAIGAKPDIREGRWRLEKSILTLLLTDYPGPNDNDIMFIDDKSFVMQNITDKNIFRMIFEK